MKLIKFLLAIYATGTFLNATAQNTFPASGNVGIGTLTPGAKLSFQDVVPDNTDGITWYSPGPLSYGIHRTQGGWNGPNYQQIRIGWETGIILDPGSIHGKSYVDVQGNGIRISQVNGSLGIGTTDTKGYKLAVAGSMIAESVNVKLQSMWPDYVFSEEHRLPALCHLEKFIQENQHLPEMPSASDVEKEGISLGEMNVKLLKKIEELTLYIIEQDKRIQKLEQRTD